MQEQESNLPAHWSLNTEQQAAVLHGDEPLLLIAGAGTGKTTTLVHRVAYHLLSGVHPARVLLLTFTRKAAQQMLQRLLKLCHEMEANELDSFDINGLWAGTFHAIGTRLLKLYGGAIGLSPRFTIHDRSDAEDLMDALLQKLKKEQQSKLAGFPKKGTLLRIFGFQVNSQLTLERVLDDHFPDYLQWLPTLKRLFSQYRQHQHEFSIADYDTLLLMLRDLVRLPDVSRQLQERFQYVLVDEYQDTNPVQAQILQGICPDGRGLTVVGDDAQSIYSFRAATIRNILDFPEQFRDTKLLKLTQNYRSTQPLLAASNAVISAAKERFDKQLWSQRQSDELPVLASLDDESEQASWVVDQIEEQRQAGISLSQQAVLFRAAFHSLALETELARRKIPFVKWGGLKFAESAHVKDLLAYLRLAENRRDTIAALRILLLLPGIGPKKAGNLVEVLDSSTTAFEVWKDMPPSAANKGIWSQFVKLMIKLSTDEMKLVDQLKQVLHFYSPLMEDRYDNAPQRLRDLEQLLQLAVKFDSREQLLVDLAIDPPSSESDLHHDAPKSEPPLVLSTIHSAKGLEWPVVYTVSVAQGMLPMLRNSGTCENYEEERRLLYVAMTRAADKLYISYPGISGTSGWNSWVTRGGRSEFLSQEVRKRCRRIIVG